MKKTMTMAQICEYLSTHYKARPSMAELADMVGMNEVQFDRLFKEQNGITPQMYIDVSRAQDAEATVVRTTMSMPGIAKKFGFKDLKSFEDAFKAEFRLSPEEHRNRFRYDPDWKPILPFMRDRIRR